MANTTTSQVSHVISFYDRDLLDRALPNLIHSMFGQVRDIPAGNTKTINFRRYESLSANTTALTEGVTPGGSQLSVTDVSAVVSYYGDFITTTDQLEIETMDPLVLEMNQLLGEQAGNSLDQLCRDVLAAGGSVQYASTAVSRVTVAVGMNITYAEILEAVRTLKGNNAGKLVSMIEPSNGIDTIAIPSCYVAIVHPDTSYDLKQITQFTPVQNYPSQASVMPGEIGSMDEVRFIESTNAKVFSAAGASSIDVYATLILGKNAYGVTRIAGNGLVTITKSLGSAGTADPLDQRSTHGWKATFVAKMLNDNFMVRLEHAVSS